MVAAGAGGALGALLAYVRLFHAGTTAPGQSRLGALGSRLHFDLTARLPRYLKAFARGEFRPDRLTRRAQIVRERATIIAALEQAAASLPAVEGAQPRD
jgi:hypothetical protein